MLKIYNTLTNEIEAFEPIQKCKVNMYVCGATTYNDIHIGNARPLIFFEVVRRYFNYIGYEVKYVSNYTDIDDRIINRSIELKVSEKELAEKYIKAVQEVTIQTIGKLPDETPKATQYIDKMGEFINKLIEMGFAYQNETGVYFRINKIKDYGILSNQEIESLDEGVRIVVDEKKENPKDFSLWKFTKTGITFDSPFGMGRPGWHTECVVMNNEIFGNQIDIHGGGTDLKFPHHENEIAQSMAMHNHHLAKYWMHVGFVMIDGGKMSKSKGKMVLLKDLINSYNPKAYILLLLSSHYRQPVGFSDELIMQFSNEYDKIERTIKKNVFIVRYNKVTSTLLNETYLDLFNKEMDNDFNVANALGVCYQIIKDINREKNVGKLAELVNTLRYLLEVLCLNPEVEINPNDLSLYDKWTEARNSKNFVEADIYRNELSIKGWI